jgi:hypothetical protein
VIEDLLNFDRHAVSDYFHFGRAPDRLNPDDLTLNIIDLGVMGSQMPHLERYGYRRVNSVFAA